MKLFKKELLGDLKKLAEFEKSNTSIERGSKLFDKLCKNNPDPDHALMFFQLLLECFMIWPGILPETVAESNEIKKTYDQLKKSKVTFPQETDIIYFFEDFPEVEQSNPRRSQNQRGSDVGDTPMPFSKSNAEDKYQNVQVYREYIKDYTLANSQIDDNFVMYIESYNMMYMEYEPINNNIMSNESPEYDDLRNKGLQELCFQSEFNMIANSVLSGDMPFASFKSQFIELYKNTFGELGEPKG